MVPCLQRAAAKEILAEVRDGVVQCFTGVAWLEIEFAGGFGAVQIPEILGHLDGAGFNGRGHVPLFEKGIDKVRARDRQSRRQCDPWRGNLREAFETSKELRERPVRSAQ